GAPGDWSGWRGRAGGRARRPRAWARRARGTGRRRRRGGAAPRRSAGSPPGSAAAPTPTDPTSPLPRTPLSAFVGRGREGTPLGALGWLPYTRLRIRLSSLTGCGGGP